MFNFRLRAPLTSATRVPWQSLATRSAGTASSVWSSDTTELRSLRGSLRGSLSPEPEAEPEAEPDSRCARSGSRVLSRLCTVRSRRNASCDSFSGGTSSRSDCDGRGRLLRAAG